MRIANIILTSQNGGAEQVFIDYATILKNLGHEILAITKDDAPYSHIIEERGMILKKIPHRFGYHDIFAVKKIRNILEEFNADAVIAHAGRSMVMVRKALKKIDKKIFFIATNHSMNVKRSIGADLVFSVNREIFYRTILAGQNETKSFVIQNALDLSDAVTDAPKVNLHKKHKIVIGAMGRLDKAKGFRFAIQALKKLQEKNLGKEFVLKIAGSGPREEFLRNLVKELKLEQSVEFLGWAKDKKAFFDSIDIFCLTSERETFGLVVLEAMKYRKPLIATATDGPREILRDGVDALLIGIDPLESTGDRLADAIEKMIENPEMVENMLENSSKRLQEKFSFKALERTLEEIFGRG